MLIIGEIIYVFGERYVELCSFQLIFKISINFSVNLNFSKNFGN